MLLLGAEPTRRHRQSTRPARDAATHSLVRALGGRHEPIRVFVPQPAMFAAAMLACAADQIIMGGCASLFPTNPMVVALTMDGSMLARPQAVVDERNEPLRHLLCPEGTGDGPMSLASQPP